MTQHEAIAQIIAECSDELKEAFDKYSEATNFEFFELVLQFNKGARPSSFITDMNTRLTLKDVEYLYSVFESVFHNISKLNFRLINLEDLDSDVGTHFFRVVFHVLEQKTISSVSALYANALKLRDETDLKF